MSNLSFNVETARECFDKLRTKGVAADNEKRNAIGHILSALLTGSMGESGLTTIILAAFGNPKTAGNKPVTTVAGLASPKNNIAGGDVMRQAWKAAFAINEMRFYPVTNEAGETEIVAVPGADAAIAAFINGDKGAPKGIYALKSAIAALQADAMGDAAKAGKPQGEGEGESKIDTSDTSDTSDTGGAPELEALATAMAERIAQTNGGELWRASDALAAMRAAIDAAFDRIAAEGDRIAANG